MNSCATSNVQLQQQYQRVLCCKCFTSSQMLRLYCCFLWNKYKRRVLSPTALPRTIKRGNQGQSFAPWREVSTAAAGLSRRYGLQLRRQNAKGGGKKCGVSTYFSNVIIWIVNGFRPLELFVVVAAWLTGIHSSSRFNLACFSSRGCSRSDQGQSRAHICFRLTCLEYYVSRVQFQ